MEGLIDQPALLTQIGQLPMGEQSPWQKGVKCWVRISFSKATSESVFFAEVGVVCSPKYGKEIHQRVLLVGPRGKAVTLDQNILLLFLKLMCTLPPARCRAQALGSLGLH